jgi:hypothetical protein
LLNTAFSTRTLALFKRRAVEAVAKEAGVAAGIMALAVLPVVAQEVRGQAPVLVAREGAVPPPVSDYKIFFKNID